MAEELRNGKLSRWLYDGKKWTLAKKYALEIEGPFLTTRDGTAIVSKIDGNWCLTERISLASPTVQPIVNVLADEPLVLIEDIPGKAIYFEHAGRVFDAFAHEIARVPNNLSNSDRAAFLTKTACSQRDK